MILRNKKGESGNWDVLIGFIVAIIALLLILGLFFRADLMNWMRNLPNYGNEDGKDREVILENDPVLNNVATCESVGKIITIKREGGFLAGSKYVLQKAFSTPANGYIEISGKKTELYTYPDSKGIIIELDEFENKVVGTINNGKIIIDSKWINDESLRVEHSGIPSKEELILINEAYLGGANGLSICKKKNE